MYRILFFLPNFLPYKLKRDKGREEDEGIYRVRGGGGQKIIYKLATIACARLMKRNYDF